MPQATITSRWEVDNVLTNVTSIVMSDPTGTFGVRRTDNSATVVADGTAMTNLATGIYNHRFTEPAQGLTYNYWEEIVYAGATYYFEKNIVGGTDVSSSKTSAVQRLLTLCGVRASASNTGNSRMAIFAEDYIDREDIEVQTEGWPENTEEKMVIARDTGDNTISTDEFGTDVLAIFPRRGGISSRMRIVRRGNNLWREDWSTSSGTIMVNTFDGDIDMTRIRQLAFSDLPEYLTRYIVVRAARKFYRSEIIGRVDDRSQQLRHRSLLQGLEQEYIRAKVDAEQNRSANDRPRNLLSGSTVARIRGRGSRSWPWS